MQSVEILEWAAPYQNNVLFCERNLQNFSHPLRPSNTSCFLPGWDNRSQDTFVPYPGCGNSRWWKEQKWIEVGGKVIQIRRNLRKSFSRGWSKIVEGFFFFSPPTQSCLPVPIDSSDISFPVDRVALQGALEGGVPQEESSGTVPTSQSVGEEVCRAAEIILCLCSLLEALGGGEGGSSWGPPAASFSGGFKAVLAGGGLKQPKDRWGIWKAQMWFQSGSSFLLVLHRMLLGHNSSIALTPPLTQTNSAPSPRSNNVRASPEWETVSECKYFPSPPFPALT